jgi:hypothetical protein
MTRQSARAAAGRRRPGRLVIVAWIACLGALWPAGAAAQDESIVFLRGNALWRAPVSGDADAVELTAVSGEVTRLEASPRGDAVLVELGERVAWVSLASPDKLNALDCKAPARFSPDGRRISCTGPKAQLALYALPGARRSLVDLPAAQVVGFAEGNRLAVADADGIWAVPVKQREQRALLAPHQPSSALSIGPRGRRAVGIYPPLSDHPSPGLYVFRLDGKGVRRRLLPDAAPVAWSGDDRWVAVQREKSACLVRAAGGEYKCWKRYQALSVSPDGSHVLLSKPADKDNQIDLYRGDLDGVRPTAPRLLVRAVTGPAVWVPACSGCR